MGKNKKTTLIVILTAVILFFFQSTSSQSAEFKLRANTIGNEHSIHAVGLRKLKELVEKRSGGRIEIKIYYSGALGDQRAGIESMQSGTIDIATVDTPITTIDKVFGVFGLPFIFRDREHVDQVMNGPVGEWAAERLRKNKLEILAYMEGGFRQITNNKRPIYTPDDLKGIKMRTPSSQLRIRIFNTYGANSAALPYPELYSALQMGVFDAQENPAIEVKSNKFYEVQKYLSFTNHVYSVSYLLMGQSSFKKLPWDLQLLVKQAGYETIAATVEAGKAVDEEIIELANSKGMKVNKATTQAFIEASKPIWDSVGKEMGDEAIKLIHLISTAGTP
jgi:tripartite ATP-independent transporter DctP family solute receptor